MKKEMSEHAAAAKAIRAIIKKQGLKGKVSCSTYSMGSSVHANVINPTKEQYEAIEKEANLYQYGNFDGMQDLYENTNLRDDLPQVKYVIIQKEYTDEVEQKAWEVVLAKLSGMKDAPRKFSDSWRFFHPVNNQSAYSLVIEAINGEYGPFTIEGV